MGVEENLHIVDRFIEAVNNNDWETFNELYDEEVLSWASPSGPDAKRNKHRDRIHENSDRFYKAWPDLHLTKEHSFGQDDWVCVTVLMEATHKGTIHLASGPSFPASGRKIRSSLCLVFRIENGKITVKEEYYDSLGWWRQLGVDPPDVGVVMDLNKPVGAA